MYRFVAAIIKGNMKPHNQLGSLCCVLILAVILPLQISHLQRTCQAIEVRDALASKSFAESHQKPFITTTVVEGKPYRSTCWIGTASAGNMTVIMSTPYELTK